MMPATQRRMIDDCLIIIVSFIPDIDLLRLHQSISSSIVQDEAEMRLRNLRSKIIQDEVTIYNQLWQRFIYPSKNCMMIRLDNRAVMHGVMKDEMILHGEWIEWYEPGKMKMRTTHINDEIEGEWVGWYPNGNLRYHHQIRLGNAHGLSTIYDTDGCPRTSLFIDGMIIHSE